jgi:hypothetical protein
MTHQVTSPRASKRRESAAKRSKSTKRANADKGKPSARMQPIDKTGAVALELTLL